MVNIILSSNKLDLDVCEPYCAAEVPFSGGGLDPNPSGVRRQRQRGWDSAVAAFL